MASDFNPLDTSQRQKVLAIVEQLSNAGLSEQDIQRYFQATQGAGQQALQQNFNAAGMALGQQFEPQMQAAQNRLGSSPLLADSGYSNRLNRQLQSDLLARVSSQYGQSASDMANQNVGFLRNLYGQRAQGKQDLYARAYQTITGAPKKKKFGQQALEFGSQALGAGVGAFTGGGGGYRTPTNTMFDY